MVKRTLGKLWSPQYELDNFENGVKQNTNKWINKYYTEGQRLSLFSSYTRILISNLADEIKVLL